MPKTTRTGEEIVPRFGVRNYSGTAVERRRRIRLSNFSDVANEVAVQAEFEAMEEQLASDHAVFFAEFDALTKRSDDDAK